MLLERSEGALRVNTPLPTYENGSLTANFHEPRAASKQAPNERKSRDSIVCLSYKQD